MYMSKLVLNAGSIQVQKELANRYELHRTIMRAFPKDLKEQERVGRVLFRLDQDVNRQYPTVLVQSVLCPDWEFLLLKDHFLVKDPMFKQFKYPNFKEGNKFWFRLLANPTKKVNGKRIGFYKEEDQYAWLERKAELSGFKLLHSNITKKKEFTPKNKKTAMKFQGTQFEGAIQVINPLTFVETLKYGIGSGKAFGFGLLTISNI